MSYFDDNEDYIVNKSSQGKINNKGYKMQYDNNMKGSAWIKTSKQSGLKYMGGEITINNQKYYISMFKNTKKENEKQPDYNIVVNLPQNQQQYNNTQPPRNQPPANYAQQTAQNVHNTFNGQQQGVPFNDPWANQNNNDDDIEF